MSRSTADLTALLRATVRLYRRALKDSVTNLVRSWRMFFVHVALVTALLIFALVTAPLVILGGFLLGLALAFALSCYFATVAAALDKERLSLLALRASTFEILTPMINVLFAFFVLNLVAGVALAREDQLWIRASLNLLLAVLFNPLPEVIYRRGGGTADSFGASIEFIKENFLEWYLPQLLIVAALSALLSGANIAGRLLEFVISNPLAIAGQMLAQTLAGFGASAIVAIPILFWIWLFRGALYRELATSSRRKRIYQERFY